ncbi:MAG TPA: FAD-dependent oxidoreductase [Microbacterium sp.]|uniref:NAD(P)/FAD-dependent oxidoreductase n=1 Tax=Microbacterium sp. TaxID=51671 RepID=UPI002BFC28BC|nr:FAD-dependent oxidoreductase [Microbacterium sp.]HWI32001.1 FAD-dependent oxidoreductase [Microbacterium sp.]
MSAPGTPATARVPFWMRSLPPLDTTRLTHDIDRDVVIVGGGLTGLWTAHYLLEADRTLSIAMLEATRIGHGASGRNGGWLSNLIPGHESKLTSRYGEPAVRRFRDAVRGSVDESISVAEALGIDADIVKGGTLSLAFRPAQARRQREKVERSAKAHPEDSLQLLGAAAVRERLNVAGVLSGVFNPHAARIHPGKLVHGLAASLIRRGVQIYEHSPVEYFEPGVAVTAAGRAEATWIVRATEGFTTALQGGNREFLSMNSSVMITRPQSDAFWSDLGWSGQELLSDAAHDYVYGQRTADGRIAIGGRGVPYRFGNGFDLEQSTPASTLRTLTRALETMFPGIDSTPDDSWSGVLGVPRDWNARVTVDQRSRMIAAGGYVGHGVAATNLAGRTIADLVTETSSGLPDLPWVGHRSRSWEPEPLRWIGARSIYLGYRLADRSEARSASASTSRFAALSNLVSGRP